MTQFLIRVLVVPIKVYETTIHLCLCTKQIELKSIQDFGGVERPLGWKLRGKEKENENKHTHPRPKKCASFVEAKIYLGWLRLTVTTVPSSHIYQNSLRVCRY